MGIDISSKVIYGLPYKDLSHVENLDDLLDDGDLDYASPYYDSEREYWVVGANIKNGLDFAEFEMQVKSAAIEFLKITERSGRIYGCAHVY